MTTKVEWGILRTDGSPVWPVPGYVADATDPVKWAEVQIEAEGGTLVCRTITTTDWAPPNETDADRAWRQSLDGNEGSTDLDLARRRLVAIRLLRVAVPGTTLTDAADAINPYFHDAHSGP